MTRKTLPKNTKERGLHLFNEINSTGKIYSNLMMALNDISKINAAVAEVNAAKTNYKAFLDSLGMTHEQFINSPSEE